MCGIFTLLNNQDIFTDKFVREQFLKGKSRGPEYSTLNNIMIKALFGFHRLAINGLNDYSNQPIIIDEIALICNGEIYNYRELYDIMKIPSVTDSDCEIIIHLYKQYGIEQTLQMIDGVFSFVLIDYRIHNKSSKIYVARDPYGVRPLYILDYNSNHNQIIDSLSSKIVAFASELKGLYEFYRLLSKNANYTIKQFPPGSYSVYDLETKVSAYWKLEKENVIYHSTGFISNIYTNYNLQSILLNIQDSLINAVYKRCVTTERPIACLLSGGLDSSLITALVNDFHKSNGLPTIETYSIGLADSEDLKYARMVADYLGTNHTEVILTEQDFLNAIPEVIQSIESYDTTTVRASIGNWLLGKYIATHSEAKVIFNGDGSDELMGGYLYMHKAPDSIEFDKECRRLLKDIHAFDVLRSDKSISSHGLEPRTPFLDREWVQRYLSIPFHIRNHTLKKMCEKYLVRSAFSIENYHNYNMNPLLPEFVLWRKKEAFSDGVSKTSRSLYEIIQEFTTKKFIEEECSDYATMVNKEDIIRQRCKINETMSQVGDHLIPKTTEQFYYRKLFETYYPGMGKIVPYFWMPKYVEANDASARTLKLYEDPKKS